MSSFKEAIYEPVKIFGIDGIYTQDRIDDKIPDGLYKYALMFKGEQRLLTKEAAKDYEAIIITKEPVLGSKPQEVYETDLIFQDIKFIFEDYFKGIHRPIDFQIREAEGKKNAQFQSKARSKTKDIAPELF